jgi:DNA-directed RNA polymerase specialized sigma24 family protein
VNEEEREPWEEVKNEYWADPENKRKAQRFRESQSRSWKNYTDAQRAKHDANPAIAASAEAEDKNAQWWRLVRARIAGRRRQIENRKIEVAERLERGAVLPEWLDELLAECRDEFTERDIQTLVYTYGFGLSQREAADALGVKRPTYQRRLKRADARVRHLRGDVLKEHQRMREVMREFGEDVRDDWVPGE